MIPGISHLMAGQLHHFSTSHPIIALLVHSSAMFSPKTQLCFFSVCLCLFFVKAEGNKIATKESGSSRRCCGLCHKQQWAIYRQRSANL